jgi:hypothetical protein
MPDDNALRIELSPDDLAAVHIAASRRKLSVEAFAVEALRAYASPASARATEADMMGHHIVVPPLQRLPLPARAAVRAAGEALRVGFQVAGRGRYRIGPGLITNGRLRLRGPGRIQVGRDVNAWARSGVNLIETFQRDAVIRVGDRVRLNGAGIQAATRVDIGDDSILGSCTILDTDHHAVRPEDRGGGRVATRPIVIGRNVWIGGAAVLKGVCIGDNSVVGLGSVVTEDVPANVVVAGNPAKVVRRLDG